eukprot:6819996-Alexandrium_andersonii.AAC.1
MAQSVSAALLPANPAVDAWPGLGATRERVALDAGALRAVTGQFGDPDLANLVVFAALDVAAMGKAIRAAR